MECWAELFFVFQNIYRTKGVDGNVFWRFAKKYAENMSQIQGVNTVTAYFSERLQQVRL